MHVNETHTCDNGRWRINVGRIKFCIYNCWRRRHIKLLSYTSHTKRWRAQHTHTPTAAAAAMRQKKWSEMVRLQNCDRSVFSASKAIRQLAYTTLLRAQFDCLHLPEKVIHYDLATKENAKKMSGQWTMVIGRKEIVVHPTIPITIIILFGPEWYVIEMLAGRLVKSWALLSTWLLLESVPL